MTDQPGSPSPAGTDPASTGSMGDEPPVGPGLAGFSRALRDTILEGRTVTITVLAFILRS